MLTERREESRFTFQRLVIEKSSRIFWEWNCKMCILYSCKIIHQKSYPKVKVDVGKYWRGILWDLLYCWGWNKRLKSSINISDLGSKLIEGRIDIIKFIQFLGQSLSDEMIVAIVGVWEERVVWKRCISWFFPGISAWH